MLTCILKSHFFIVLTAVIIFSCPGEAAFLSWEQYLAECPAENLSTEPTVNSPAILFRNLQSRNINVIPYIYDESEILDEGNNEADAGSKMKKIAGRAIDMQGMQASYGRVGCVQALRQLLATSYSEFACNPYINTLQLNYSSLPEEEGYRIFDLVSHRGTVRKEEYASVMNRFNTIKKEHFLFIIITDFISWNGPRRSNEVEEPDDELNHVILYIGNGERGYICGNSSGILDDFDSKRFSTKKRNGAFVVSDESSYWPNSYLVPHRIILLPADDSFSIENGNDIVEMFDQLAWRPKHSLPARP